MGMKNRYSQEFKQDTVSLIWIREHKANDSQIFRENEKLSFNQEGYC